jgi:hypothetical protein
MYDDHVIAPSGILAQFEVYVGRVCYFRGMASNGN